VLHITKELWAADSCNLLVFWWRSSHHHMPLLFSCRRLWSSETTTEIFWDEYHSRTMAAAVANSAPLRRTTWFRKLTQFSIQWWRV